MRCAAILGPGCSEKDLGPFQRQAQAEWGVGLPENAADADVALVFGGDGTMHRHLGALVRLGLPVLVVPRGSGNDFARALDLNSIRKSLMAWQRFASGQGHARAIDLGVIRVLSSTPTPPSLRTLGNGLPTRGVVPRLEELKYFCCVGGIGLDAEVARRANLLPRWLRGRGGYALSLPSALRGIVPAAITLTFPDDAERDGLHPRSQQALLVAFANTPNYGGGMTIAPKAKMDDGKLDVCLVSSISRLKLFSLFPTVYFGRHVGVRGVEYFQTARFKLETDHPQDVYADGEFVCRTPIEVSIAPQVLKVITA